MICSRTASDALAPRGGGSAKNAAAGGLAELMHQLMKTTQGISEPPSDFRAGQTIDEIRSQRFVLPVGGVLGDEEGLSRIHLAHRLSEKGCFHGVRRGHSPRRPRGGLAGNRRIPRENRLFLRVGENQLGSPHLGVPGWKHTISAKHYPIALWRKGREKRYYSRKTFRPIWVCGNPG